MPAISSRASIELLSRLEFSAMAASRAANMPHSKRDAALSKAASGALTLSVIWYILVTPNPKPVFVSLIGVAVRRPLRRSSLRVTEWIGSLNRRCNGCFARNILWNRSRSQHWLPESQLYGDHHI